MRLLIIITTPAYDLWQRTEQWQPDEVLKETPVRVGSVGQDKIVILCQAESTVKGDSNRDQDIRDKTTPWVLQIANSAEYSAAAKVYAAAHSVYVDLERVRAAITKERFGGAAPFNHYPGSPNIDVLYDALDPLISKPSAEAYETAIEAIKKKQALTHSQRLSILKHRLAHLFLPISIDLQAWSEFDFDDEYMKEMVKSYSEEEGRLARARELLYGQELLPGADSMEKIVKEVSLEGSPAWEKVKSLLPSSDPASDDEKREAPSFSDVFQTKDVLGCLKERKKLNTLKTVLITGNPFNNWYAELESALVELRSEMERPKQG